MAFDYRSPSTIEPLRKAFSILGYPIQLVVDMPFDLYNKATHYFSNQNRLVSENKALQEQLRLYSVKYHTMQVLEQENKRLRKLLKARARPGYSFSMAEVLAASDTRGRRVVTLNKGSQDGVHEKQVVLVEGGNIFGQIIDVTPFSSRAMLLTDRQHAIPVRNRRTGMKALANGTGKSDTLELKSINANSDVREGDVFLSSGLDQLFPPDFPVAQVIPEGVTYTQGDPFANIKARPFVNFDNTREVLLLWRTETKPSLSPAAIGTTPISDAFSPVGASREQTATLRPAE